MQNKETWHVLLAEDDLISQHVAMKRLKRSGLQAELAKDGIEAWKMFLNNDYDLILMDLRMPQSLHIYHWFECACFGRDAARVP